MKYNAEEQKKINDWLVSVGVPYLKDVEFNEYKDGQLLEIVEAKEDNIFTWDEWQHVQIMMGMEIPLSVAIRFSNVLWENDISVLDLSTDKSKQYYSNLEELRAEENAMEEVLIDFDNHMMDLKDNMMDLKDNMMDLKGGN